MEHLTNESIVDMKASKQELSEEGMVKYRQT